LSVEPVEVKIIALVVDLGLRFVGINSPSIN